MLYSSAGMWAQPADLLWNGLQLGTVWRGTAQRSTAQTGLVTAHAGTLGQLLVLGWST